MIKKPQDFYFGHFCNLSKKKFAHVPFAFDDFLPQLET